MRKTVFYTLLALIMSAVSSTTARADAFFQLPIVPDSMGFENRVNYLVDHYWDFCDLNKAFSSRQRMADAFKEYLDLMPLATGDHAINSVNAFIGKIEKKPENLLFITTVAEEYMYSDTAEVVGDLIYLPFVQAVARNKKIDKASKARYERQARLIGNCQIGSEAPDFTYIDRKGEKRPFKSDSADVILLYIYDTDCPECSMARIRLHADINTTKLIDAKRLRIVAISPTTPDGEWRDRVASYPEEWEVGAVEDFDDIYEVRSIPTFYVLDDKYKIFAKNLSLEQVLDVNRQLAARTRDPYIPRHQTTVKAEEPAAAPQE